MCDVFWRVVIVRIFPCEVVKNAVSAPNEVKSVREALSFESVQEGDTVKDFLEKKSSSFDKGGCNRHKWRAVSVCLDGLA